MLHCDEAAQGYNAHTQTFTSQRETTTQPFAAFCCFRCHLFLCAAMWSSRGLLSPAVAQEAEGLWRGCYVLVPALCSGEQPPRPSQRYLIQLSNGIPSEHAQSAGLVLGRNRCATLRCGNHDGLTMRLCITVVILLCKECKMAQFSYICPRRCRLSSHPAYRIHLLNTFGTI